MNLGGINSELYLQINRSPSFGTDEKIDFDIKSALIEDTVRLLNIKYVSLLTQVKKSQFQMKLGLFIKSLMHYGKNVLLIRCLSRS